MTGARPHRRRSLAAIVVALVLLPLAWAAPSAGAGDPTPAGYVRGTARELLDRLPIRTEHRTGYDRDLFSDWIDVDGDGCDTRYEVLIAEAIVKPQIRAGCYLANGRWYSAYDGVTTGDPSSFDIDHMVPLAEAWDSGAWTWPATRRRAYANDLGDPRPLRAVTASTNRSKGDDGPDEWMPPRAAFACRYLAEWVAVKARWGLSVDQAEHDAIARRLRSCAATELRIRTAG